MRVLVLGATGSHRTEESIARALRALGHRCRLVDVPWWFRYAGPLATPVVHRLAEAFQPDAVVLTRPARLLGEAMVRRLTEGRTGGFWYFDLTTPPDKETLALGRAAGAMFVSCCSQLAAYRAAGISHVHFLPQAMDPAIDRPAVSAPSEYRCDLSFLGSGHYPYRHQLLRRLAEVGSLQIRGLGWNGITGLPIAGGPVRGADFARAVRGAAVSLGAHATLQQDAEHACTSNRMWKIMGCEGFYLGPWQNGLEAFARGGEHCVWYRTIDEAVELAQQFLARPRERAAIAVAGREHALRHHTYVHRVDYLLKRRDYPFPIPSVPAPAPAPAPARAPIGGRI